MKKISTLLLIILAVALASCSEFKKRAPATERNPLLDEILTIAASKSPFDNGNLKENTETQLKMVSNPDFIEDFNMPAEKAFRVEIDMDPKTYKISQKIYYGASAFNDKEAVLALSNLIRNITFSKALPANFPYYEMYYNAKRGHLQSLKNFALLKNAKDVNFLSRSLEFLNSPGYEERVLQDAKLIAHIDAELKKEKGLQKTAGLSRKSLMAELDKLPEEQQLRNVIARGDRSGAALLIKKYLPWELMAPFEKKYWETYLDVMENPAPLEERVLIYRGVDDDMMQAAAGFSKEQAQKESKAFYMSTMMTKNQGSWNRRLRSFEAMYDKRTGMTEEGKNFASTVRMTTIFSNHAGEPVGSPFLSFSPDIKVAMNFGRQKVSAYLVDPRLLSYNFAGISQEAEFLVGLTTFPEDMVGLLVHGAKEGTVAENTEFMNKKLIAKIETEYGQANAPHIINKIKKNSYNFFLSKYKPEIQGEAYLPDVIPGPSNLKFYNGLKKDAVKPLLGPTGNLNCATMIQMFWK